MFTNFCSFCNVHIFQVTKDFRAYHRGIGTGSLARPYFYPEYRHIYAQNYTHGISSQPKFELTFLNAFSYIYFQVLNA